MKQAHQDIKHGRKERRRGKKSSSKQTLTCHIAVHTRHHNNHNSNNHDEYDRVHACVPNPQAPHGYSMMRCCWFHCSLNHHWHQHQYYWKRKKKLRKKQEQTRTRQQPVHSPVLCRQTVLPFVVLCLTPQAPNVTHLRAPPHSWSRKMKKTKKMAAQKTARVPTRFGVRRWTWTKRW